MTPEKLPEFQQRDTFCAEKLAEIASGNIPLSIPHYFTDDKDVLFRRTKTQGKEFEAICIPETIVPLILDQTHDLLGHNGTPRMYEFLKRLYFWPGMQKDIQAYVRQCGPCQKMNTQLQSYPPLHLYIPTRPLQFIAMDLIGPMPQTLAGNKFALTIMDMLTAYIWAFPIPNKEQETVIHTYLTQFYTSQGSSCYLLSDNGREFKNAMFDTVAEQLGLQRIFSSPHHPQGNSKLEAAHKFLKNCITKYAHQSQVDWDSLIKYAACAYNFFPNQHSRESPFFLMHGRDPIIPLDKILGPRRRYVGDDVGRLDIDQLTRCWALAAYNIRLARDRNPENLRTAPMGSLSIGDPVLLKDYDREHKLTPRYLDQWRISRFVSDRQVELVNPKGKKRKTNIQDISYQYPAHHIARNLPETDAFGRACTFVYHPSNIPNLHWSLTDQILPFHKPPTLTKGTNT